MHDLFDIVGLAPDARAADVRRACRRHFAGRRPGAGEDAPSSGDASWRDAQSPAVDFGAIEPLVGRMRARFFGAPDIATVDVPVTPWHLRSGAPVHVAVPARVACADCQGRGEIADLACPRCAGAGLIALCHEARVWLPADATFGSTFDRDLATPDQRAVTTRLRVVPSSAPR